MQYYKDANNEIYAYEDDYRNIPAGLIPIAEADIPVIIRNRRTIEEAKLQKRAQINAERDAQASQPVTVHGRKWQADERSYMLLTQAIQLYNTTKNLQPYWRDIDNNNMPIENINQLIAIAYEIGKQISIAYTESWIRKDKLEKANTLDEIDEI